MARQGYAARRRLADLRHQGSWQTCLGKRGQHAWRRLVGVRARAHYQKAAAVAEAIAKPDPAMPIGRRDPSVLHDRIGDVLRAKATWPRR